MKIIAAALLMISASTMAIAQQAPSILNINDRFVASSAAAKHCGPDDPGTAQKYASNYTLLLPHILNRVRETNPGTDMDRASQIVMHRNSVVENNIQTHINTHGCDDELIAELLKLYHIHAEWDIMDSLKPMNGQPG